MKIHQLFLIFSFIASASMYGMDEQTQERIQLSGPEVSEYAVIPPLLQQIDDLTMDAQEQTKHTNAHFKSSGYSDLNKRRSYTDDFAKLFPYGQPEEWASSAVICCAVCPCITALFIKDKCCPTDLASDTEHDKNN